MSGSWQQSLPKTRARGTQNGRSLLVLRSDHQAACPYGVVEVQRGCGQLARARNRELDREHRHRVLTRAVDRSIVSLDDALRDRETKAASPSVIELPRSLQKRSNMCVEHPRAETPRPDPRRESVRDRWRPTRLSRSDSSSSVASKAFSRSAFKAHSSRSRSPITQADRFCLHEEVTIDGVIPTVGESSSESLEDPPGGAGSRSFHRNPSAAEGSSTIFVI